MIDVYGVIVKDSGEQWATPNGKRYWAKVGDARKAVVYQMPWDEEHKEAYKAQFTVVKCSVEIKEIC